MNSVFIDRRIILNIINMEAKVCVRKYLIDDSDEYILVSCFIKGIIEIKLISNPIHIPNHE